MTGEQAHDALEDGRTSPARARRRALLTPGAHPGLEAQEKAARVAAYTAALEIANFDFEVEGHRIELLQAQAEAIRKVHGKGEGEVWDQIRDAQARKSADLQLVKALRKALRGASV